jgi:hypothetical protein
MGRTQNFLEKQTARPKRETRGIEPNAPFRCAEGRAWNGAQIVDGNLRRNSASIHPIIPLLMGKASHGRLRRGFAGDGRHSFSRLGTITYDYGYLR